MFNVLLFTLFSFFIFFESYKHVNTLNFKTLQIHKSSVSNYYTNYYYIFIVFLFNKLLSFSYNNYSFLMFLLTFCLFFNLLTKAIYSYYTSLVITFFSISYIVYQDSTIISIIFGGELLSVLTMFLLFFNNNFSKSNNTGIFYFLVNNIITFLFGVLITILLLSAFGTLNFNTLKFYCFGGSYTNLTTFLFIYFLLKLGQNLVVFFKFRFYKFAKFTHLIYYIITYTIFIWPLILILLSKFALYTVLGNSLIFLLTATIIIFQSIFMYKSFVDFMVFSTWVFMWYQILFILG